MTTKKLTGLLLALCLTVTALSAAQAQETGKNTGTISEKEFSVLLTEAFPGFAPASSLTSDKPLTFSRALAILFQALGIYGQTDAENLAYVIENDLITGLAATSSQLVSVKLIKACAITAVPMGKASFTSSRISFFAAIITTYRLSRSCGKRRPPLSCRSGGADDTTAWEYRRRRFAR